ncbi:MAG: hypothetical protein PHW83_05240 [Bacteroidales bacterium]|nr:hypothetical protein [Bacteroidales bacterium]
MKKFMLQYLIIGLICISCQGQKQNSDTETQKIKIQLNDLSDTHPNKQQMEHFLNNYKEEFIESELNTDYLKNQHLIQKQYCFRTKHSNVSLTLIFCEYQKDALSVAEANFNSDSIGQEFGINGSTLFIVEGNDKLEVNSVLSHFAGEE